MNINDLCEPVSILHTADCESSTSRHPPLDARRQRLYQPIPI